MKSLLLSLFATLALVGCQQSQEAMSEGGEESFAAMTELADAEFPAEASGRSAKESQNPRVRIVVRWGGGLLSCADWKPIELKGSNPLFHGVTRYFEFRDSGGRPDDHTAFVETRTCGYFDEGAISMDVTEGATLQLRYTMKNLYKLDKKGQPTVQSGSVDLSGALAAGDFRHIRLEGGNYLKVLVQRY